MRDGELKLDWLVLLINGKQTNNAWEITANKNNRQLLPKHG